MMLASTTEAPQKAMLSADVELPVEASRSRVGLICGLLIFSTVLIPWGVADEKFMWSFRLLSNFYTVLYRATLFAVWLTGLTECYVALKSRGNFRNIAFVAAGAMLVFYLSVAKANPIAWTAFAPFAGLASRLRWLVFAVLAVFAIASGVQSRQRTAGAALIQALASALVTGLALYGIAATVSAPRSGTTAVMFAVDLLALALSAVGGILVLSQALRNGGSRRLLVGRALVLTGVILPVLGQILEPIVSGDQIAGIFAYLNTEIIVAGALLLFVEGVIGLSARYRHALTGTSGMILCGACAMAAMQRAPHTVVTDTVAAVQAPDAPAPKVLKPKRTGDWTQWCGGADRNMVWNEKGLPDKFEGLTPSKTTGLQNVKWVVPLAKRTLGSPVVAGGKVYLGGEDISAGKEISMLWCFEAATGKLLWRMSSPYIPWLYNLSTFGNCATPTIEGDRVYTCNHLADVLCLSAEGMANGNQGAFQDEAQYFASGRKIEKSELTPDGKRILQISPGKLATLSPLDADILWRFDLIKEVNSWPFNALNSSVLIHGDHLFVGTGTVRSDPSFGEESWALKLDAWQKQYGKSGYDSPSLIVLDKATGKLLARDRENIFPEIFHGAHSSPALGVVNGKELLFYGAGNGTCYAFDPNFTPGANGAVADLKSVWKFNCLTERIWRAEIIATPVFYKNRIYVAIGNDLAMSGASAGPGRLVCIDATQSGDITSSGLLWSFDEMRSSATTVAIADDLLYTGDAAGNIYCFDANTGKLNWRHTARHPVWSSPLVADGKVYLGLHSGGVLVFAHSREKKIISENLGNADIISSPAISNGVLYIASQHELYALETGKTGGVITKEAPKAPGAQAGAKAESAK